MLRQTTVLPFLATLVLLCACDRLDPLAVIDSPDGRAVILDILDTGSGDRVICIRSNIAQPCSRSSAEVVVSPDEEAVDVGSTWEGNNLVIIEVASGNLERSVRSALKERVNIEYR